MVNQGLRVLAGVTVLLLSLLWLGSLGPPVHGTTVPAGVPQWGPDIRVNIPMSTTRDMQKNSEMAVDPTNPNHVLASYDSEDQGASNSGLGESTDGGRTWQARRFYGPWISDTVPYGNTRIDFDKQGTAYYSTQILGPSYSGYAVLTTTLGMPWSAPVPVVLADYSEYRYLADLIVDRRASGPFAGSVYMAWSFISAASQGIRLSYSRDGARTWSQDSLVSDPAHTYGTGPSLAVARDGTLYVAFVNAPPPSLSLDTVVYLNRSTDGGVTWGPDRTVGGGPITRIGALDIKEHTLVLPGDALSGSFLIENYPVVAVAPDDPRTLYIAWNDGRWDSQFFYLGHPGKHGDIAFSRSTDGGDTWSAPQRINDDPQGNGADQFTPSLAIGPDGRLGVTWNDRRDDPAGYLYHLYYSESTDGGLTWSANQRVSDVPSDPMALLNPKGEGNPLGYNALAYGPDYVLPGWVDSRAGQAQDLYTDRGVFVPATPTPSATASPPPSATPSVTRTASPTLTGTPLAPSPTASATVCAVSFADVPPGAYYAPAASWLACHGVVAGYTCGGPGEPCPGLYYRPSANSTRGQLSKMIVLGLGWPVTTPPVPTFVDVPSSQPFYPYIETAVAHGALNGYDCGGPGEPCPGRYFRPSADVTRGQLSKIIVNAKGWGGYSPPAPSFMDVPSGSPFYGYVERAVQRGIISGYDCGGLGEPCPGRYFRPSANATRAQLSKILYNALLQP